MSRLQVSLNVDDVDAAVDFYARLFGTGPSKWRPGYANFALDDPPLKLCLMSGYGVPGTVNHLGVEVDDAEVVDEAAARLAEAGIPLVGHREVHCCYARQAKVWMDDPAGARWEVYTVVEDTDVPCEAGYDMSGSAAGLRAGLLRRLRGQLRRRVRRAAPARGG